MQEYREVMMVKLKVEQIGKDKELCTLVNDVTPTFQK